MTEPITPTIDDPAWPEARPPHLPDRLTAMSLLSWPFAILGAFLIWRGASQVREAMSAGGVSVVGTIITASAPVATVLAGAVLFVRHPDAIRTLPRMVIGVVLLAAGELLRLAAIPLEPVFAGITPVSEALPFLIPLATAFDAFTSLVSLFGLLYLARGLDEARRFEDRSSMRALAVVLVALAAVIGVLRFVSFGELPADDTLAIGVLVVLSLGILVGKMLTWGYVVVVALRGWRAGEAPAGGWLLAALAGAGIFVSGLATLAVELVVKAPSEVQFLVYSMLAWIATLAWVVLLAALALGLPSTMPVAVDEAFDAGATDGDDATDDDDAADDEHSTVEAVESAAPTLDPPAATPPGSAGS
jgi:hypothetical protein